MIDRHILHQPILPLRLIPLLRIRPPIHEKTIRLLSRTRQNTKILAPRQLRYARDIMMAVCGEVRAERGLELLGDFGVVDRQREGAGDLEGGVFDGVAGEGFGGDDAADAGEGLFAGCRVRGAHVDSEARVVDDDVLCIAGLDAGAGYDGGVVAGERVLVFGLVLGRLWIDIGWGEGSTYGSTSRLTIVWAKRVSQSITVQISTAPNPLRNPIGPEGTDRKRLSIGAEHTTTQSASHPRLPILMPQKKPYPEAS